MKISQVFTAFRYKEMKINSAKVIKNILLISTFFAATACSETNKVIENDHVRLVFSTKPIPFLKELVQKPSQINLLPDSADQNFFSIEVSQPGGKKLNIESSSAKKGSVNVIHNKQDKRIIMEFAGLGPDSDMKVKINGILDNNEPLVRWSIGVENPNKQKIITVRFPYVAAVPAIGLPEDDFIIGPAFPGALIENPSGNWPEKFSAVWSFPGVQSAQLCSYQDKTAGVYMASMDTVGYGRSLRITKEGGRKYILTQEYVLSDEIDTQWKSPYDVTFGVTSGSWQQTADIYKKWALKQSWCAKTLVERDEIPQFWKEGPCIHVVNVRTNNEKNQSYYSKLPEHLRNFRELIDGPVVPLLVSWEKIYVWAAGDYFPVYDESNAKVSIEQCRKNGFFPFYFLSGMFYSIDFDSLHITIPGSERFASSYITDEKGNPKINILTANSGAWRRHSYQFCPSAPGTSEFFRSVIAYTHNLGVNILQMDQATSGASPSCYSTTHGHPLGTGPYQSQNFRTLLYNMRDYGKSLAPDFMLMNEELHEELIPFVDGFHVREYKELWWYRALPGTRGIPLFTYLYHEFAIAYGGDSGGVSKDEKPILVRDHAVNLVSGKTPGVAIWSDPKGIYTIHPDQLRMIRNHSHLLKTEASRFLMLGRMLHPIELEVPSVTFQIGTERGGKKQNIPFVENAVFTSSWQSPEGKVGHCLVNITNSKQIVKLQLDTRNASGWPSTDIDLIRADKPVNIEHLMKGVPLPQQYVLELEPLEAVFFVIQPAS